MIFIKWFILVVLVFQLVYNVVRNCRRASFANKNKAEKAGYVIGSLMVAAIDIVVIHVVATCWLV